MKAISPVNFQLIESIEKQLKDKNIDTSQIESIKAIAYKIASIQDTKNPSLLKPTLILLASSQGISELLGTCTKSHQLIASLQNEASLLRAFNPNKEITTKFVDLGLFEDVEESFLIKKYKVKQGTENFVETAAMEYSDYENCLSIGETIVNDQFEEGCTVIGFGTLGAESKLPAALVVSNLINIPVEQCIHFNNKLGKEGIASRIKLLHKAQEKHTPLTLKDMVVSYGSLEIAVLTGAYLSAAALKMTILIDSFVSATALLYAYQLNEHVLEYCFFCNQPQEKGTQLIIDYFEKETLLKLSISSDKGLGVLMAYPIIKGAVDWLREQL